MALKILYAEDNLAHQSRIMPLFGRRGYKVTSVWTGHELLWKLERRPDFFDIIVTDNDMPGIKGLQVLSMIRRDHELQLPVIVYTGEMGIQDEVEALDGIYLDKMHCSGEQLCEEIERVVKTKIK